MRPGVIACWGLEETPGVLPGQRITLDTYDGPMVFLVTRVDRQTVWGRAVETAR